ncbi:hypothetical protein AHAS_Ahas19G0229000 [Arachis hypogaea]
MHGVLRLIVTLDSEDRDGKNCGKSNNYTISTLCNTLGLFSYDVHRSNNRKQTRTVGKYSSTPKSQLYSSNYVGIESYSFSPIMAGTCYC